MNTISTMPLNTWLVPRPPTTADELALRLVDHIDRKACGRIRDLHVLRTETGIELRGWSRTYHAKQLAQEAALDLLDSQSTLANQIQVMN